MKMVKVKKIPHTAYTYTARAVIDQFLCSKMKLAKITEIEEDPSKLYFSLFHHCRNFGKPVKVMWRTDGIYLQLRE
jgi:hypothetical protein